MRKSFSIVLSLMFVLMGLSGCGGSSSSTGFSGSSQSQSAVVWRMNIPLNLDSTWGYFGKSFADKVKELSGEKYTVEVYPNEQLTGGGGGSEAVQMVQQGLTDFDIHNISMWQNFEPKLDIVSTPFIFANEQEIQQAIDRGLINRLTGLFRESCKIQPLGYGSSGGWNYWTKKDKHFRKPEDFKGVKMRSPNDSFTKLFTTLGANPAYVTSSEVVTSLQQGVVDAVPYPLHFMYDQRITEIAPYLSMPNAIFEFCMLTTSTKLFDSLPANEQQNLLDAGKYATDAYNKYVLQEIDRMCKEMEEKHGAKIYRFTPEENLAFKNYLKNAGFYKERRDSLNANDILELCGMSMSWIDSK